MANFFGRTLPYMVISVFFLFHAEGKTFEKLLEHDVCGTLHLTTEIPQEKSADTLSYKRAVIKNVGDKPVRDCFPFTNQSSYLTLDALSARLANEQYPLLALYQLWQRSLILDESSEISDCHPLDLLNFKGACSKEEFVAQFIKLCDALGIQTRLANIHGKERYDFRFDDEWNFLDLLNNQIYLSLDNTRLVSSEEVMDDPFLALRTKHQRQSQTVDFHANWMDLAQFEILEPSKAMPVIAKTVPLEERPQGFDLFPNETLTFAKSGKYDATVQQSVDLEVRRVPAKWNFSIPIPLKKIKNESTSTVELIDLKVKLKPGQSYIFRGKNQFQVACRFSSKPRGHLTVTGQCARNLLLN